MLSLEHANANLNPEFRYLEMPLTRGVKYKTWGPESAQPWLQPGLLSDFEKHEGGNTFLDF